MKNFIRVSLSSLAAISLLATSALALAPTVAPTIYDNEGNVFTSVFFILYCGCLLLVFVALIAFLVFEIMMLIDLSNRSEAEVPAKQTYIILMVVGFFVPVIGIVTAIVYYFSVKKHLDKKAKGLV